MRRANQLLIHIGAHLVTRCAKRFGVCRLHRGIETAPEDDAADEAAQRQEAERQIAAWVRRGKPVAKECSPSALQHLLLTGPGAQWERAHPGTCLAPAAPHPTAGRDRPYRNNAAA